MGIRLDAPEEVITFPPIDSTPDGPEDRPTPGPLLVGISDPPLPALLRTVLHVLNCTGHPLDAVQTYSHLTLQTPPSRPSHKPSAHAHACAILAASPLGNGLLMPSPTSPPAWHPAPEALREAVREAVRAVGYEQVVAVTVAWSVRLAAGKGRMPVVVGMSNLREVHETVTAWRRANDKDKGRLDELECKAALAQAVFNRTGTAGWTWSSGNCA